MTSTQEGAEDLRDFQAMIWKDNSSLGACVKVRAKNFIEARQKLETEYGEGTVFDLHNESDANIVR